MKIVKLFPPIVGEGSGGRDHPCRLPSAARTAATASEAAVGGSGKGNTSNDMNHYVEVEVYGRPAK